MATGKPPPGWRLGPDLMDKSLELALEDPAMAVRLANLGVRVSAFLAGGYDPFAERGRGRPRGRNGRRRSAS
ncbi:MAG TPA: hypothetical protein VFR31_05260 [Thermoanaerobaculia bacterium]|nr:hypothetical protein [Thermoanaerobaculia bacterium]